MRGLITNWRQHGGRLSLGSPTYFFMEKIILLPDNELVLTVCIMCTDVKNVLGIFRLLTVRTNGEDVLMVIGGSWRHSCKCSEIFYQFFGSRMWKKGKQSRFNLKHGGLLFTSKYSLFIIYYKQFECFTIFQIYIFYMVAHSSVIISLLHLLVPKWWLTQLRRLRRPWKAIRALRL